jgi:chemotaxis protein methyltransferase CheR
MLIDTLLGPNPSPEAAPASFEIIGTDISPSVLFLAIAGRYNQIEITRGLEDYYRNKYFTKQGMVWVLNEAIRKRVTFKKFNLQDSFAQLGRFDMVLCRNVAIYFSDIFKRELFAKLAQTLNPGGHLFIGSAESLSGYSNAFKLIEYKNAIYYRKAGET